MVAKDSLLKYLAGSLCEEATKRTCSELNSENEHCG